MFFKILLFEISNRIRRPAVYLYFAAILVFSILSFGTGSLPVQDKEHINSPYLIAFWMAGMTMMMMLVSSSIMGTALYRDIEFNTKDYYLTYPITKSGYFWGRYVGAFLCMIFIGSAIPIGIFLGTQIGPGLGWKDAAQFGSNRLVYYLHPFLTIALPNIFFTSSLFFGLVAATRNIKVIYFGGILLFLCYFISIFFLNNTTNVTVVNIADPFALNPVRYQTFNSNSTQQNTTLIPIVGAVLINRLLWSTVGLVVILITFIRFTFEKFFSGRSDRSAIDETVAKEKSFAFVKPEVSFVKPYQRRTLINLTRIEILNIIRDNYFWIIFVVGSLFLGFVFWIGQRTYGVPEFSRTVMLLRIFNDVFPFFIFFIIMFYTGETLHRDRATRYAFINDSLPPPNWVMNGSKLITLLLLAVLLAFIPFMTGIVVQTLKGFYHYNLPAYASYIFLVLLPKLLEMVMFCYVVHTVLNNKFVAHAVGSVIWIGMFFLADSGIFNYNLLLYSHTPEAEIADMNGIGHMITPISWFDLYWLLGGGLLIIVAALFYYRGVNTSFKERLQVLPERFNKSTKIITLLLSVLFLLIGSYIYYNISYLNTFLMKTERTDRQILYEQKLKRYENLPLPKLTSATLYIDLFPKEQQEYMHGFLTIVNKNSQPIKQMLFDMEDLTDYSIKIAGKPVRYTCPLLFDRGFFSWFKPKKDSSDFRLYELDHALRPGDSLELEINSYVRHTGFSNDFYFGNLLRNGIFFTGGLPDVGYDADEEVASPYVRKKSNLPPKKDEDIPLDDPVGIRTLRASEVADLFQLDMTVSTSSDQTVVAPGELDSAWKKNDRNYYHFSQNKPGTYMPFGILSARYAKRRDSVMLDHKIYIDLYFHPEHAANIDRFIQAYKDGLAYYSKAYGAYPFKNIRLAETSMFGPQETSTATMNTYSEAFGWNGDFSSPANFDYSYFPTVRQLAQQWWRFQVAPNHTTGSMVIPEGISNYGALILMEKKLGKENMRGVLLDQLSFYLFVRRHLEDPEHPLLTADKWYEYADKFSVAMYGLRDLIGEDSINAALREFKNDYAFKKDGPFAGSSDLLRIIRKHVPDSMQYYLDDTWERVTLYDNQVDDITISKTGNKDEYKVDFNVTVDKSWLNDKGTEVKAEKMNDYIDIGILGKQTTDMNGDNKNKVLYLNKYKLKHGTHHFSIIVKGKPETVGIDPFGKLIDRNPNDNLKTVEQ